MSDIEREQPIRREGRESVEGAREVAPEDDGLPSDAPAAGVLDDDLEDPPEPNEPG